MSTQTTPPRAASMEPDGLKQGIDDIKALAQERQEHIETLKKVVSIQKETIKTYQNILKLKGL